MQIAIFDTALGRFGIGWTDRGLARVLLPGDSDAAMLERLNQKRALSQDVPRSIAALMDRIEDYAEGEPVDFSDITLDLSGTPDFHGRVYQSLIKVGWGQTTTYGGLARQLGDAGLSRAVGQAMGANPLPLIIPCHRVLASNGKPGGFSAPGGTATKVAMLALEGVYVGTPVGQMGLEF